MSFQSGLSGLNAASRNLDVIGNNIANANSTGFKTARTEFSAIVASTVGASAGNSGGIGVRVSAVSHQFTQGSISITGNNLDVAVNGGGFLQLTQPDGSSAYTRDGSLKQDKDGFLKTNSGANVMGVPTDKMGVPTSGTIQKLQLPTGAPMPAIATKAIEAELNLDARAPLAAGVPASVGPPPVAAILPTPRATYGTSVNAYDAQGVASPVNLYFEKSGANQWQVFGGIDVPAVPAVPAVVGPPAVPAVPAVPAIVFPLMGTLNFDSSGQLTGPLIGGAGPNKDKLGLVLDAAKLNNVKSNNPNTPGFLTGPFDLVFGEPKLLGSTSTFSSTQFGNAFSVSNLSQDGYSAGELIGTNIEDSGLITSRYSNGQIQYNGQVTLANFANVQGLAPQDGNAWTATFASGNPVQGAPGTGKFGGLRAGALEDSNVDLTAELVNMMTAQRAYQANAQTIKTQDQVMSTLVNLR